VPGDVVQLKEGDQIPADVRLVDSVAFACEEAILTGESVAVSKTAVSLDRDPRGGAPPLGDRKNMGFFGCVASRGRASAVVTATGMSTELGRIATSIGQSSAGKTGLQKQLELLGLSCFVVAIILGVVVMGVNRFKYVRLFGGGRVCNVM
jgi:Ca2+-transporting ATPase